MLDVKALRYFVYVAEMKSVSRAASALYIAQPAISRQIKKLEELIGVQLLVRTGRGIELTDAGALLEIRARDVLKTLAGIHDEVAACADIPQGVVSIAMSPAAGRILAPALVMRMHERFPKVSVKVSESFTGAIRDGLRARRCDLGVLHDPQDDRNLRTQTLLHERLLVVGPGGKDADAPVSYNVEELEKLPLILPSAPNQLRILADDIARANKLTLNIVAEIDSIPIMKALIEEGYGYGLLSFGSVHEEVARGVLRATPVDRSTVQRKLVVAWNPDQRLTNAAREVVGVLTEIASDMVQGGKWRGALSINT